MTSIAQKGKRCQPPEPSARNTSEMVIQNDQSPVTTKNVNDCASGSVPMPTTKRPLTSAERRVRFLARHPGYEAARYKKFRQEHPGYKAQHQSSAYQDREQRRQQRLKHKTWTLDPSVCEPFACDGEDSTGTGIYDQWAGYNPTLGLIPLQKPAGISLVDTANALHKARSIQRDTTGKRLYATYFSMGYDMDQQIAHLRHTSVDQKLAISKQKSRTYGAVRGPDWTGEEVLEVEGYGVYVGRKQAVVRKLKRDKRGAFMRDKDGLTLKARWVQRWYDCFSLFNRSFVGALEIFKKNMPEALHDDLALVEVGKKIRGHWQEAGWSQEQVAAYNAAELKLLYWLTSEVIRLCKDLELSPRSVESPAQLSRAAITKYGCGRHIQPPDYSTVEFQRSAHMSACKGAYYGGRIELLDIWRAESYYVYDITSAYPAAIRKLPCLAHGYFRKLTPDEVRLAQEGNVRKWSVLHVEWKMHKQRKWGPLPVRLKNGAVFFPLACDGGWYHQPEVSALFKLMKKGDKLTIHGGYTWESTCSELHPFQPLVKSLYSKRQTLLAEGNPAEYIIKLALNSLYGLFAQTAGRYARKDELGNITGFHHPKFCNLFAAGYITSHCRASILEHTFNSDSVFMVATDAIYSTERLPIACPSTKVLGEYSESYHKDPAIFIQPGVVASKTRKDCKTRGFPFTEEFYDIVEKAMENGEVEIDIIINVYQDIRRSIDPKTGEFGPDRGKFVPKHRIIKASPVGLLTKRLGGKPYRRGPPSTAYMFPGDKGYTWEKYQDEILEGGP